MNSGVSLQFLSHSKSSWIEHTLPEQAKTERTLLCYRKGFYAACTGPPILDNASEGFEPPNVPPILVIKNRWTITVPGIGRCKTASAGTAADDYQTLEANGGPSHTIVTGLFLGDMVDGDDGLILSVNACAARRVAGPLVRVVSHGQEASCGKR